VRELFWKKVEFVIVMLLSIPSLNRPPPAPGESLSLKVVPEMTTVELWAPMKSPPPCEPSSVPPLSRMKQSVIVRLAVALGEKRMPPPPLLLGRPFRIWTPESTKFPWLMRKLRWLAAARVAAA